MTSKKSLEQMTDGELRKELAFTRECLNEEEEILSFMLTKTTLNIELLPALKILKADGLSAYQKAHDSEGPPI